MTDSLKTIDPSTERVSTTPQSEPTLETLRARSQSERKKKTKQQFAPVPQRAMRDQRLTSADLRLLMAIAAHDRFTYNKRGCYAGSQRLAACANCDATTVWRSTQRLCEFAYIDQSLDPNDRRKRIYRVIYNDDDALAMKVDPKTKKIARPQSSQTEKDCIEKAHVDEIIEETSPNIFCKTGNTSRETKNICSETATPNGVVDLKSYLKSYQPNDTPQWISTLLNILQEDPEAQLPYPKHRPIQSLLCELERTWKTGRVATENVALLVQRMQDDFYDKPELGWNLEVCRHAERIYDEIVYALDIAQEEAV